MRTAFSILLLAFALALSPCAYAQVDCNALIGTSAGSVQIESAGKTAPVLVHSSAFFEIGTIPHSPVVTRAENEFTIKYMLPQAGPAVPYPWDDTFSLGVLPSGTYRVTVVLEVQGGLGVCEIGSADFLLASQVPALNAQALLFLGVALGAAGYGLLRLDRGVGV